MRGDRTMGSLVETEEIETVEEYRQCAPRMQP